MQRQPLGEGACPGEVDGGDGGEGGHGVPVHGGADIGAHVLVAVMTLWWRWSIDGGNEKDVLAMVVVIVVTQVMMREDSTGGWVPLGGGGLSHVAVRKRKVKS